MSPLEKVGKVKGLDEAFAYTERTDNRKGIAAVNLAREKRTLKWTVGLGTLFNHLKG